MVIDASYGIEMKTSEFLHIAAAHGMPKGMGILTYHDDIRDGEQVRQAKTSFKDRIEAEIDDGGKVFDLSGITTSGEYRNREVLTLACSISITEYPNIRWHADHPYVLADRVENITPKTLPSHANRSVVSYGYVQGSPLRLTSGNWRIHLGYQQCRSSSRPMSSSEVAAASKISTSDGHGPSAEKNETFPKESV